jgi:predicted cupin superfamily sugar epimerase
MQHEQERIMIDSIIKRYNLQKHPEGGYFAEIYRSEIKLQSPVNDLQRNSMTDIYYLLVNGEVSRFHKVIHDEIWNFYEGAPLKVIKFDGNEIAEHIIGPGAEDGYKVVVEGGVWQAAVPTGEYSLVGCTVAPGFDFADFAFLADDAKLAGTIRNSYSDYEYLI